MLTVACGKSTNLDKARKVYARWERGWQEARPCLFGKVERTIDPKTQLELAELLGERSACPSWLLNDAEKLPDYSVAQFNEKALDKELDDRGNAINLWHLLQPEDLTDEVADDIAALVTSVKALHSLGVHAVDAVRIEAISSLLAARQRLRDHLGFPAETSKVTIPTPVTMLTLRPAPPPRPAITELTLAGKWKVVAEGKHYVIAGADGAAKVTLPDDWMLTKDAGNWSTPDVIEDAVEPIVWITRKLPAGDRELRGYQLIGSAWKEHNLTNVVFTGKSSRRLDVVYRNRPATERDEALATPAARHAWLTPGTHTIPVSTILNLGTIGWLCSSDEYLWLTSDRGEPALNRFHAIVAQNAESVPASFSGGTCENDTVYDGNQLCTINTGCKPALSGYLLDGQAVSVHAGPALKDGQLLVMRTSTRKEKLFRLPAGKQFAGFSVRDRKPIVTVTEFVEQSLAGPTATQPMTAPRADEPMDYQCGGGRVVPRIGCECPAGSTPARTPDNIAICAGTKGTSSVTQKSKTPTRPIDMLLPWPL
ncbi:MAG: hypothetical protein H0V17_23055 [Deltaproteobacteria bacterium]|nr:hypothetical protein [Deltaproteobacteria bacterium]